MEELQVLFVDDEAFTLNALERLLRKEPYTRHYAENGAAALELMAATPIHIVVTDMKMPGMDGLTLLRQVKQQYPDTVRLALSAYAMTGQLLPCINSGEVFRFVTKPIVPKELRQAIGDAIDFFLLHKDRSQLARELKQKSDDLRLVLQHQVQMEKQLQKLAVIDELTGLYCQRYLTISLEHEFEQYKRYRADVSCLMLDLDDFKQVNDTRGRGFGDFVLREFSSRLRQVIRSADLGFRYDGEAFVVLLPRADLESARVIADRILHACRTDPFEKDGQSVKATVSVAVVCLKHHQPNSPTEVLERAAALLSKAKKSGRDTIIF